MSLVFDSRDVSVGPTMGLDLSSSPAFVSGGSAASGGHDKLESAVAPCLTGFLKRDGDGRAKGETQCPSAGGGSDANQEASSESSSIGVPSDSEDNGDNKDEEEVDSKSNGSLGCLGSLEESLPIKRGLSNHFSGKSKSFANLSEVITVKEMEKQENQLNKRRRLMIAYKWSKKSSFYSWKNPTSMPLLALNEEDNEEQEEQVEQDSSSKEEEEEEREDYILHERRHLKGFKSCFSLTDLQK